MSNVCTPVVVNGQNCISCTGQPFIAAVAGQTITDPHVGWNSSAYSIISLSGDCYTQFSAPAVVGVVCGLAPVRLSDDPRDVPFAFYLYQYGGQDLWVVAEGAVAKTSPIVRTVATDTFRIERRGSTVRYFVNGKTVYTSATATAATLLVVCCMYAAGDGVN